MTTSEMKHRDIVGGGTPTREHVPPGSKRIAVIGIDRYASWPLLHNAVRDAEAALRLFEHRGFELVGQPLFDDAATGAAIHALVTDELTALGQDDSLVLFFAGHGETRIQSLGGEQVKSGYLIPVDAARGGKAATWIDLDDWLRKVARLPPRHILVFLDACFAGIALSMITRWRDSGTFPDTSLASLQARRSRRIITSALDDQVARDSGPVLGHSLFTGCLLEGFERGLIGQRGHIVTGTEVGLYLQQRVRSYPDSHQIPDFGTFEYDERGEMVIPLSGEPLESDAATVRPSQTVSLAIATVTTSSDGTPECDASRGSRARWIAAIGASLSIVLVSSFTFVSSFDAKPPSVRKSPAHPIESRAPGVMPPSDAATTDREAATETSSDAIAASAVASTSPSPSPSNPGLVIKPEASGSGNTKPRSAATSASTIEAIRVPRSPSRTAGANVPSSAASSASSTPAVTIDKRRVRAPSNRRLKLAVDENDCPVEGSHPVTIDSIPPGATLYLNHKECGAVGKTPWKGKLAPSRGTVTGKFTAIFERPGEEPLTTEFEVEKIRRLQRVEVRMPRKP